MKGYKYCVAHVYVNMVGVDVSYYAYQNNAYGLYLEPDKNSEHVLWYDTEQEARKHIQNSTGECVMCFCTDYIPKFNKKGGTL